MSATEYRAGDIAMMRFRPGSGPEWRPAVRMRGYLPDRDTWHALDSGVWLSNPEVGPVLGNVGDIAAGLQVVRVLCDDRDQPARGHTP